MGLNPEIHLNQMINRYPQLAKTSNLIAGAYKILEECFNRGGKLLIAGNGGSAADADHIVGELMKGFKCKRKINQEVHKRLVAVDREYGEQLSCDLQGCLPTIALHNHGALCTAFLNDVDGNKIFAQQVYGYGLKGDVFLGISTSGNSKNIIYAAVTAKAIGMKVIGLTGIGGGKLAHLADLTISVPEDETYRIQELHLPIYHCLCLMLEEHFWGMPMG